MIRHLLPAGALLALVTVAPAQSVPTNFVVDTLISTGLQAGHDFCFLPDGRVLIANRGGPVHVWADTGAPVPIGTVPNVETGSERGLLSIAADPNFPTNGYIYVWWSSASDAFMHLDRFTCTGDLANPNSTNLSFSSTTRRVVLSTIPDNASNHNGGSTRFGPDGKLYQTIGDDAGTCTAQSQTSKAGCMLRMDVSGLGAAASTVEPAYSTLDPGDNPNSASTGFDQLVIAYGLRNPVRMEIDQVTGNCYIGDVGQSAQEEYSEYVYPAAGAMPLINFGWPWREGTTTYTTCGGTAPSGMLGPIASETSSAWNSVMGGPRYRNQGGAYDFGPSYEGDAFYLDYFAGEMRHITFNGTSWQAAPAVPGQPSTTNWASGLIGVCSVRQGPDGGIWLLQHPSTYATTGGFLKRIRPLGPTNSVTAISGDGQIGPATEAFAQPLVVRVFDTSNNPMSGGIVNFSVAGPGVLSTVNPVIADANGYAQTSVTAANVGGAITVTASTPGSQTNGTFALFSRKTSVTWIPTSSLLLVSVSNKTNAVPANIPLVLLMSWPGSPVLPTVIGDICTDPSYPLTVALEDGIGAFGGVSFSGSGSFGTPGKTWLYTGVPAFLLNGNLMSFQTVGFDPIEGVFRTNCETKQF
ncbi:MAG: PQQ-dependent sugar dehydrogenase [Planctomycetes bacterium]|nr:PQQ-dependent sugar dehydrogenase [Planctomycetota bacterium]